MAKIAFILLCHKDPAAIVQQAKQLTAAGDCIAIHFDGCASDSDFAHIKKALSDNPNVAFAKTRVKCGWGEWSLVKATLAAVQIAVDTFPRATHFYMVSGDCMAIKSADYAHQFLTEYDQDFIESFDFFDSFWIKTGLRKERLIYRHYFNERTQPRRFYASFQTQRRLGLYRKIPADLQIMIGSQWWCLRRQTVEKILDFLANRRDVIRFFRTTWIPDETFFQTLVRHLVPTKEIDSKSLTFLMFTDYGMPVTFYNDHYDLLLNQDALFARKISVEAHDLKDRLGQLYASKRMDFANTNEGQRVFTFLTNKGRDGRRYATRFWENQATLGRDRELMIIACKKWHVAKRLTDSIRKHTSIPALDYIFNEDQGNIPDLGGIQSTLEKRQRHRRAFLRMLFDYHQADRMVICLDTSNIDLITDFYADRSTTRLLEISCDMTDGYLTGHAKRVGLAGDASGDAAFAQLLPTIRHDVTYESDMLREADFMHYSRLRQSAGLADNIAALTQFLTISPEIAQNLAQTPHLFAD